MSNYWSQVTADKPSNALHDNCDPENINYVEFNNWVDQRNDLHLIHQDDDDNAVVEDDEDDDDFSKSNIDSDTEGEVLRILDATSPC